MLHASATWYFAYVFVISTAASLYNTMFHASDPITYASVHVSLYAWRTYGIERTYAVFAVALSRVCT